MTTVLVAEPDAGQRQLIDLLLAAEGWSTVLVGSGEEALLHLETSTVDVALLALDLPDIPGDVLCTRIRRLRDHASMPVILVAQPSMPLGLGQEDRERSRKALADLILPRPLGDKNLRERIERLLNERTLGGLIRREEPAPSGRLTSERPTASPRPRFEFQGLEDGSNDTVVPARRDGPRRDASGDLPAQSGPSGADATRHQAATSFDATEPVEIDASVTHAPAVETPTLGRPTTNPAPAAASTSPRPIERSEGPASSFDVSTAMQDEYRGMRRETETLRIENAQLKRRLSEKAKELLESDEQALRKQIRELEEEISRLRLALEEERRKTRRQGSGLFGRRS